MKTVCKILAYALLIVSVIVQPMDKKPKKKKSQTTEAPAFNLQNWTIDAGNILLNGGNPAKEIALIKKDKNFLQLTPTNQTIIIQSLQICAQPKFIRDLFPAISNLINFSDQLNKLINDPSFSLALIKHYSQAFNSYDEVIAKEIGTDGTRKRLELQDKFVKLICTKPYIDPADLREFRLSNFDLTFTDKNGFTPAEMCVLVGNAEGLKVFLVAGADPEPLYSIAVNLSPSTSNKKLIIEILEQALREKFAKEKRMKK